MKNKDYILFIYNDDNMKNEYINKINKLYNSGEDEKFFKYYYILFNKNIAPEEYRNLEINIIFHVSNNFKNQAIIEDLNKYLNIDEDNNSELIETEKITNNNNLISSLDIKNTINQKVSEVNDKNKNEGINNSIQNTQIIKEVKIEIKEENITIKETGITKENDNFRDDPRNDQIIQNKIKDEKKEEKSPINDKNRVNETVSNDKQIKDNEINNKRKEKNIFSKDFRQKRRERKFNFTNIKNKIHEESKIKNMHNKQKDKNIKNIQEDDDDDENDSKQSSNKIIKLFIVICVMALVIYFIFTRYLCVGFIKIDDNQIIEFNNQANKLEII